MIDSIVIATDGSESVDRAITVALDLASKFDAEVHGLYVLDTSDIAAAPAGIEGELRAALRRDGEQALGVIEGRTDGEAITAIREGRPVREIIGYAREKDIDVVATGTRGRHGENRLMLGSVAEGVVRTCPLPVLTVRQLEG